MGSAVALFFGASLLSIVEIVYYFTLRLCRRQPDQKKHFPHTAVRKCRRIRQSMLSRHIHHVRGTQAILRNW
jgi:hypothetical protein